MIDKDLQKTLFVGDVNVDLIFGGLKMPVLEDKEVTASSYEVTMGSTSVITAAAFTSCGGSADFCGLAGDDDYGSYMIREMQSFNIGTEKIKIDSTTSTGVTVNLIYKSIRSQVTYPGTIELFTGPDMKDDYSNIKHVHFSGIYQQLSFIPKLEETIIMFKSMGITTSLDTQWDITEKWNYLDKILPLIDILFVNFDEACSITGTSDKKQIISYFTNKSSITALKLGSKGSIIIKDTEQIEVSPFSVDVIDTTGAGDSYAGAFLYAYYEADKILYESGLFASAAAARSCMFHGGVNAKSTVKDITDFMERKSEY